MFRRKIYIFIFQSTETLFYPANPEPVNHYEIGRYFYKYEGMCYLPNEEKAREYPEDEEFRNQMIAKTLLQRVH